MEPEALLRFWGGHLPQNRWLYTDNPNCPGKIWVPASCFVYEAQNTAVDVLEGQKESNVIPWTESIYIMEIMNEIRR